MSFAKMHTRKTMSFLTPQAKKTLSPARLSFGGKNGTPEKLLGGLLKDPIKRALLMEVLSQDTREDTEKPKVKTKNPQKFKFESPSALCRRRALEKMRANSDSSDNTNSPSIREQPMKEVPFDQILSGVIAYVEIKSNNMDRSAGAKALMQAMGAKIKDVLNRHVTHVVFKDGSFNTFQKAKLLKVHLVSVLWIEAVHKNRKRVPEKNYPALGAAASDADASFICKLFQQEYADVIQEELEKSNMFDVNQNERTTCTPHTIPRRKATRLFQRENHAGDLGVEMLQYKLMKRKDAKIGEGNGNSSDDFEETPQFLKRPNYKEIDLASQLKGIKGSKQNKDIVKEMFETSTGRTIFKEPSGKIARRLYNTDDPIEGKCSKMNSLDSIKLTPINYQKNMKFTSCTTPRRKYTRLFQKDNYQDSIDQDTLLQDKSNKSSYGKLVKETGHSSDDFEETPNFLKRMRDKDFASQRKRMKNDYPKPDVNESNTNAAEKTEDFKTATCRSPRLKDSQGINVNILSNIQISPARQSDSQRGFKGDEIADSMRVNSDETMKEASKKLFKKLCTSYDDVEDDRTFSKTHMIKPINYKPDMEFGFTPRRKYTREFQRGNYQENIDKETLLQDRKLAKEVASSSDDFEETPSFLKKITNKFSASPRKLRGKNDYTRQGVKETSFRSPEKPQDFKTPSRRSAKFKDIPDINLNILKSFQISPPRETSTFSDVKAIEMSDFEIKQLDNSLMLLNCI